MTGPTAPSRSAEVLAGYLDRAAGDDSNRDLAHELLAGLVQAGDLASAALYLRDDGARVRELVVGEGAYPLRLGAEEETPGMARLPLAGGELLFAEGPPADGWDVTLLLPLAAAMRSLVVERKLKRQRFEVNYRGVELEALYDVGLAIASTLNLEQLSEEILLRAVSLLDARRGALYAVREDGGYRLSRIFGGEAKQRVDADDPQLVALLGGEPAEARDLMPGAEHLLAVAIESDDQPRGLLVVGDKESRHGVGPFGPSDRRTLGLFANQAAIALENANLHRQALEKERLEREVELAAEIQRRLLPARLPEVEGLELGGWNRPARHVGGDYYDVLDLGGGRLAGVVADVSGKGMPAALMVSTLHSALHLLLEGSSPTPELMARLNNHIFGSSAPNKFITLLAADVEPRSGELRYINAGHNPAIVVRASGEIEELPSGGLPLGFFRDGSYREGELRLDPGDLLCLFSDGITEAASPDDEEFGSERLAELLRRNAEKPLAELIDQIDVEVSRFADGAPQADDQTVLLIRKSRSA